MRPLRFLFTSTFFLILFHLLIVQSTHAVPITATWKKGLTGKWSAGTNWDIGSVPKNSGANTYNVIIDGENVQSSNVTLDINILINSLQTNAGDNLNINGKTLRITFPDVIKNDGTIKGWGSIDGGRITNRGIILANREEGPLQIKPQDPDPPQVINSGVLGASSGGKLVLFRTYQNFDREKKGKIVAYDQSSVELNGATVIGGILVTEGNGKIYNTSPLNSWVTLKDLELTEGSVFIGPDWSNTLLQGTITNNGSIMLDSKGNVARLEIDSDTVTLAGTGKLVMSNNNNNQIIGKRLINDEGHTIEGSGTIGTKELTNKGTIRSKAGQKKLTIIPGDGGFVNFGRIEVQKNSTLNVGKNGDGKYIQNAGESIVNGILDLGELILNNGDLQGTGTIKGDVHLAGNIKPGEPGGLGKLTIDGNLTQTPHSIIWFEIGGPDIFDQLEVTGLIDLRGSAVIELVNNFIPNVGDQFNIMNFGGATRRIPDKEFFGLRINDELRFEPWYTDYGLFLTVRELREVPEPACFELLAIGVVLLLRKIRERT